MKAVRRVVISGYYGYSNTGDEAILGVLLRELRRRLGADTRFQVISGSPAETEETYGVDAVLWSDTAAIAESVRDGDLVVTGGGGIFHDYGGIAADGFLTEGNWGIGFHATAAVLAGLFEKPLAVCGVGIGPLLSREAGLYVRAVFEAAGYASVRDEESRGLAVASGVAAERVRLSADPAFLLEAAGADRAREILEGEGIPEPESGGLRVMVAVRHWAHEVDPEVWEGELARGLERLVAEYPRAQLVFVPFQRFPGEQEDDLTVARRMRSGLGEATAGRSWIVEGRYRPEEVAGVLAQASLVVAMRLHAAIFSLNAGVPFVAIAYDGKVRRLMERVGRPWLGIAPGQLTEEGLLTVCRRALGEPRAEVGEWRELARVDFDRIANVPEPARLTEAGRELLRQGVSALTGRERFLRRWLSEQKTNYEYMVSAGRRELTEARAGWEGERQSLAAELAAEREQVAGLLADKTALEAEAARLEGVRGEQEATIGSQARRIGELEGEKTALELELAGLRAEHAGVVDELGAARRHHAEREAEWSSYAEQVKASLATYRSQRAWRLMLAARRAYTVATRQGWMSLLPWLFRALRGKGTIESEQLIFPLPPKPDEEK